MMDEYESSAAATNAGPESSARRRSLGAALRAAGTLPLRMGTSMMNRRALVGISAATTLLLGGVAGVVYWRQGQDVPPLAAASETEAASDAQQEETLPAFAPQPLKPIPAPAEGFADLQVPVATPAPFQFPVSASLVSPAAATNETDPDDLDSSPASLPPQPPSSFSPFPPNQMSVTDDADDSTAPVAPENGDSDAETDSAEQQPAPTFAGPYSAFPSPPPSPGPALSRSFETADRDSSATSDTDVSSTNSTAMPAWNTGERPSNAPANAAVSPAVPPPSSEFPAAPVVSSVGGSAALGATGAATASTGGVANGTPGPRELEGEQAPVISLEKLAPAEIQVGKAATFQTVVRNLGQIPATGVTVTDFVPRGTRLVNASPQPTQGSDGALVWQLGTLKPADEVVLTMELMPEQEGEIGSVARVSLAAEASVRTLCTKPQLAIRHSGPASVLMGDQVAFAIEISNPGSGAATRVILEEDVPTGLVHPAGRELEFEVGTLLPKETRRLELVLAAEAPGLVTNVLRVRAEGGLVAEHSLQLEVTAPQIEVVLSGPARRYLERQATYQATIANPGTAPAHDIDLVAYLPRGLRFMEADQQGQYDQQNHAVFWSIPQLPAGQKGIVQITALPIETGEQKIRLEGRADMGLNHQSEHTTLVEGVTQLQFSVSDVQDPIEVGKETAYNIRVTNSGTKAATNVHLTCVFPPGMSPLAGDGASRVTVSGQQAVTDPLPQIGPGEEAVYRIRAQGAQAGDHIIRIQLTSDDSRTPVTKEEGTRVYADE